MIIEAISTADTEHVVSFLLTAYVETLEYYDSEQCLLSAEVKRLPIRGMPDISHRVCVLDGAIDRSAQRQSPSLIQEAVDVFGSALQRLQHLQGVLPIGLEGATQVRKTRAPEVPQHVLPEEH
ncbi:MAG: hypothetical protein GEV05_09815 [Betaproteobacteria bacterium]|nr:hypothetical protein [Betaproteobacteria bacterium]